MNRIRISFHNTTLVLGVMLLLHTITTRGSKYGHGSRWRSDREQDRLG